MPDHVIDPLAVDERTPDRLLLIDRDEDGAEEAVADRQRVTELIRSARAKLRASG